MSAIKICFNRKQSEETISRLVCLNENGVVSFNVCYLSTKSQWLHCVLRGREQRYYIIVILTNHQTAVGLLAQTRRDQTGFGVCICHVIKTNRSTHLTK